VGTVCRPAVGLCDFVESCGGSNDSCPPDVILPNGATCSDGDACTMDSCADGVCVIGPPSCAIGGTVHYYRNSAGAGSEPGNTAAKEVPNVGMRRTTGSGVSEATTNASGAYAFGLLDGDVAVQALSKWGTPRASDDNGAVTSFDATLIARHSVGLTNLTTNQEIAADVSGAGGVSSYDAALVAQFAVELIDHFPVATLAGSDWRFEKATAPYPNLFDPVFSHTPMTGSVIDNFYAILYGDVSGSWVKVTAGFGGSGGAVASPEESAAAARDRAEAARPGAKLPPPQRRGEAVLSLSRWPAATKAGERRQVAVYIDNADGILGMDFELAYDPAEVSIVEVKPIGLAAAHQLAANDRGGRYLGSLFGTQPLQGSGQLLIMTVEARRAIRRLPFGIKAQANEGQIPLRIRGSARGRIGPRVPDVVVAPLQGGVR
jgi:hypothetical protein